MIDSVLFINSSIFGSTGKIVNGLSNILKEEYNIKSFICYPNTSQNSKFEILNGFKFGNKILRNIESRILYFFGYNDRLQFFATKKVINYIKKTKPSIIHLHNLHSNFFNLRMLFNFFNKSKIPIIWTFHDCWPITGRCPHFTFVKCDKWKNGCYKCCYPKNEYPKVKIDKSKEMWKLKKNCFTSLDKLTIVTPSIWLSKQVKQSFLYGKNIKVINNGIDLSIFKPIKSDFRKKNNLENNFIILGVSFNWNYKKGLDVFIELSKKLSDKYKIVLVGTNNQIDKMLPSNIISIHKTTNQIELAEIYTSADVFFNPTREENYPTVNMEAIACGTPVITFNTGGSSEILSNKTGIVLKENNIEESYKAIIEVCENKKFIKEDCIRHAESFDMHRRLDEYIQLYKEIAQ